MDEMIRTRDPIAIICAELALQPRQVSTAAALLEEGATIPFIARYRKEATGSLDEVALTAVRDRLAQLAELEKRRAVVLKTLRENGQLTEELKAKVESADTLAVLEDVYLPFRPKRRTRASVAREKGLEPLAQRILAQDEDPLQAARAFVDAEKGVAAVADALAGARDIVAEWVNENADARARLRRLYADKGKFVSCVVEGRETEGAKYKDYFDWQEALREAPSHRVLAMRRAEKEGVVTLRVSVPEEEALAVLAGLFVKGESAASEQVGLAVEDGYRRLLAPAMETEVRLASKQRADEEAIRVFASNLRELLMASPLGQQRVMGVDPGFRTGCKLVCLDAQGKLLHTDTIYPLLSDKARREAAARIRDLCERFVIEAVAVGNGTGGRETEAFLRELGLAKKIVMVNESGASVYSASAVAREEFPDQDLTVRGAASIGRRLMDPLAELVKIDPKSIGVGQYQHDVDQRALKRGLDDVVMSCVNAVGVEVNTASPQLLGYISGLGPQLARSIVAHRESQGPFSSRRELLKVPRLGPKAFEQAAGFLRIRGGGNPLDGSAVHPESYPLVAAMAEDLGCEVTDLMQDGGLRERIELGQYVTEKVGLPTLTDILEELAKPGRDPREAFEDFSFAEGVNTLADLQPGMRLPGIVTNVTAFGAFVDVGVHQDGLVHISELADHFVKDPHQVVKVHQRVQVTVLGVEPERRRIGLSLRREPKGTPKGEGKPEKARPEKQHPKNRKPDRNRKRDAPEGFNNPFARALRGKTEYRGPSDED